MSGRFVRASSFRHVFGQEAKKEGIFQDVRPECTGQAAHISCNEKYWAISLGGGGGPVQIGNIDKPGRVNRNPPKLAVHKGKVLDTAFCPFVSNLIATASDDCRAKVSQFPDGGLTENISQAQVTLEGHVKKVQEVKWNPVASNILATHSADNTVKCWDIENQVETSSEELEKFAYGMDWNTNGSMLAVAGSDKKMYLFDPRNSGSAQTADIFPGSKQSSVRWAKDKLIAVGFTKSSMRQYAVWDPRNLSKALVTNDIDQSAGVLISHYDPDNSILYLGGKGDGGVKYFEIVEEEPYAHSLSEYRTNQSQKGVCFLPKKGLDTTKCEIARCLRLMRDQVVPVSFTVPRKSDMFQKDLFPDAYAGVPALSASEWLGGQNKDAPKMSLNPKDRQGGAAVKEVAFKAKKSPADLQRELDAANKRIAELEAQVAKLKA